MQHARQGLIAGLLLAAAPLQGESLRGLEWLAGCWQSDDGSAQEVWAQRGDGLLLGFGIALDGGRVAFYELLTITVGDDGLPVYTAQPAGQSPTAFVAADLADASARFVNAEHDYPQEIAYRLDGEMLVATISALHGERAQTFVKRRCR